MAFHNYNSGDILRIRYEAGSNPGTSRLVIFRELTDLRLKGPGFKATDHTGITKCFCIADVSGHKFLASKDDPSYTDWYDKVSPDDEASDDQDRLVQALKQLSDSEDNTTVATDEADAVFPDVSTYTTIFQDEVLRLQEGYMQNKHMAMAAFENEWETSHQPRLERSIKRARRTQLAAVRTALDAFERSV